MESKRDKSQQWDNTHGSYVSGRSFLDGVDTLGVAMTRKWGQGRLRLLVSQDLRERFDKQRYLLQQAVESGGPVDLINQCQRMANAWHALDKAAEAAGAKPISPETWEVVLRDGTVAVLVQTNAEAAALDTERGVVVFTLAEIGNLLNYYHAIVTAKLTFPGAAVANVRKTPGDPLDRIDRPTGLETEMEDDPVIVA